MTIPFAEILFSYVRVIGLSSPVPAGYAKHAGGKGLMTSARVQTQLLYNIIA